MFELDCKVLNVFLYIYKYKSVSIAAENLGMNQPTVSNILNRVRQHYNDPLFLRIGNEMVPTELSKQLFPLISEALNKVEGCFERASGQAQKEMEIEYHRSL